MAKISYRSSEEIAEVIVRDGSFARIESRKFNIKDTEEATKVINWLMSKYGMNLDLEFLKRNPSLLDVDSEFLKI